ncbi:MAG TPA: type VI secretion system accessory protein TagJ [Terriglobales bacterium]|jgi:type VI secretion system protein ImpE|nr:type VI secretion system accessory protein TagJ [Terriglobales bacterium]
MTAAELFRAGRLQQAIEALGEEVRNAPLDAKRRTFLFELLCFAGEYDRAEKHLSILADSSQAAGMGALLYRSALHAERERQQMFADRKFPMAHKVPLRSISRGGEFGQAFGDADPRIGGALELFVAGSYTWVALEQIARIEIPKPKRLRDLLWTPAIVTTTPEYKAMELGEVLVPAISPLSWQNQDDDVRLGRTTVWIEDETYADVPVGQKLFVLDGQEIPILELGTIEFEDALGAGRAAS